jgi:hypothetical protein
MKKILQVLSPLLVTAVLLASVSGCVPLVIGAAAGVGGFAWVQGELVQDINTSAEKLHRATTRAMRDLKLAVYDDKGDRLSAKINAKFVDGTDVNIHINAKTEYQAAIKIRVGILGDKEKSEMILNAIKRRL